MEYLIIIIRRYRYDPGSLAGAAFIGVFFLIAASLSGAASVCADTVQATPVADLPVVELRAASTTSNVLVLILSGDGGWADLDRDFGRAFQSRGVSTLGFDCLKYFWTIRKPAEVSRDLTTILRHYVSAWQKQHIVLIGYSFGASWLPFLVNRLPPDLQKRVTLVTLLAPGKTANVEIKFGDWLRDEVHRDGELDATAEAMRLRHPVLCIYGADEESLSLCPLLKRANIQVERVPGGHHFDNNYAPLQDLILQRLG